MKLILINNVYEKGSTGNIVKTLYESLKRNNDVFVIQGRGKKNTNPDIIKKTFELESKVSHLFSKISGNMYGGLFFSTKRIIHFIKKIKPDVVNLHCLNGYFVNIYMLLKWLGKNKIKTVLTMHADFMMTGGCGYTIDCNNYLTCNCKKCKNIRDFNGKFSINRTNHFFLKLKKAIEIFDKKLIKVSCVSPWLTNRYLASPIYKNIAIKTILNPVDNIFKNVIKENPYTTIKKNILYVTPDISDYVKSGWLIKEIARIREDLNFTVICTRDIDFSFENANITYIKGGVSKETLAQYYYYADETILLSKRETFSMVVAESLMCGTPICGFMSGGPETIAIKEYSNFVSYGDIEGLAKLLGPSQVEKEKIIKKATEMYDSVAICKQYLEYYKF